MRLFQSLNRNKRKGTKQLRLPTSQNERGRPRLEIKNYATCNVIDVQWCRSCACISRLCEKVLQNNQVENEDARDDTTAVIPPKKKEVLHVLDIIR